MIFSIFKGLYIYQHMTSELKRQFIHKLFFIIFTTNFCTVLYFILMSYFQHLAVLLCQNKYFVTSGSWGSPPITIKLKSFSYQHCKYVIVDLTAVPWWKIKLLTENKIIGRRLYNFSGQTFSLVMENILGNEYGWLLLFDHLLMNINSRDLRLTWQTLQDLYYKWTCYYLIPSLIQFLFNKYSTSRLLCNTHAVAFEKFRYLNIVEYLDYSWLSIIRTLTNSNLAI